MDGKMFDNVKHEKEKAMARFNRFRRIAKLWKGLEVLVVLVLLSWWSKMIPAALKISGEFLIRASACVFNSHVVFLIGNAIIVALFVLCKQNNDGDVSEDGDLYDEYREAQGRVVSASNSPVAPLSFSPENEEMSAADEAGKEEDEKEKRLQIVVAENLETEIQCEEPVVKAIVKAEEQIQRFQRTQSEKLRREIAVRPPQRELRRSETQFRRSVTSSMDTVEALSNEEFKLAVDAFIDKHQRFFKEQKVAELKQLKV